MLCRLLVDYSIYIYNIYLSPERKKNDDTRTSTKQCIDRYKYLCKQNIYYSNKMRWKINRPKIDQIWS